MREERLAEARRFVELLSAGLEEAETLVRELLNTPSAAHDEWLAAHPAAGSVQPFQLLLDAAEREAHSDPQRALELTEFVMRHVDSLDIEEEAPLRRAALFGRASAIRARALVASGRDADAIEAYEKAIALYRASPVLQLALADIEAELALVRSDKRRLARTPDKESAAARLLAETPSSQWPDLVNREELANRDAVEQLLAEVAPRADQAPNEAVAIADLAIAIADALPVADHGEVNVAQLRAQAQKNRAFALRALNRYAEALEALDRAEAILALQPTLAHDQTIMRFARATILDALGRHDEAAPLLAECRQRFRAEGDGRGEILCEMMEATVLWRMRKSRSGRAKLLDVLAKAEVLLDAATMAAIHNNLGFFAIDAGDFAEAEQRLEHAVRLWREADRPVGVAKSLWGQARAMLRKGEIERGIEQMMAVRKRFLGYGLVEEAGLSGLEIVEANLAQGKADEAEALARNIIREFSGAGLNRRAIAALSHLGEAIAARRASAATVENVREFIHSLRKDPNAEFRATA